MRILRRLRRLRGEETGYSLVELLVTMAIMGVVMGGLTTLFVSGSNAELDMNRRFQAQQGARLALDKLRKDVHCASDVTVTPAAGASSNAVAVLTLPTTGCVIGATSVSWCVIPVVASSRYKLVRDLTGSATCASGTQIADYLTANSNIFTRSTASQQLIQLAVDYSVAVKGPGSHGLYRLTDKLALRNSTRQ